MSMTQEQELAALRAELERLRADQSKAIEKLAELIGERNDLQAKLSLVNLKRYQKCGCVVCICEDDEKCHGCGAKNCNKESCVFKSNSAEYKEHPTLSDLQAKLATVEADCAAMRDVCQQVFNDHFPTEADTRCRQCYWKLKDALEDGSGQRLLDELAVLRETAQHMVACRALLNVPNNEVLHQAIQDLRETAQRRLDWLKKYESGERLTCPECGGIVSAPQRHTPDCRLGKDVATEDAK